MTRARTDATHGTSPVASGPEDLDVIVGDLPISADECQTVNLCLRMELH